MTWTNEKTIENESEREKKKGKTRERISVEEGNWEAEDRRQEAGGRRQVRGRHLPFRDSC